MEKMAVNLGIIQETLLIPLWARAIEAGKADPILKDLKAVEILKAIDYDFDKFVKAKGTQVGACLRGFIIDRWVRAFLQQHPEGTVVEIGSGLDTRYERLDNGKLRWFDLDLPDAMEVRKRFFEETTRRTFISSSVLESEWMNTVRNVVRKPEAVFFVAEGILIYLAKEQVKELLSLLADNFQGCHLAFDAMSPFMVKHQHHHDSVKHTEARFGWGIKNIKEIETWDKRLSIEESLTLRDVPSKYYNKLPLTLRMMFLLVPRLRQICSVNLTRLG